MRMNKVIFIVFISLVGHTLIALTWSNKGISPVAVNEHSYECQTTKHVSDTTSIIPQTEATEGGSAPELPLNLTQELPYINLNVVPSEHLVSDFLASIEAELHTRLSSTEQPHTLLKLTEQALLLKQPKLLTPHMDKILNQTLTLDSLQQEELLILLENELQSEHLDSLYPYLTSQYEDVQEEAFLRLTEINDSAQVKHHLSYLASYGQTPWVREEAQKQLDMAITQSPIKANQSD